jgi:serralysin
LTNPDAIPAGLDARCRPVAVDGPLVEAERRRLDMLFAMTLEQQCNWPRFENEAMRFLSGH